jgi:toxin ParE1/3/4
VSGLRNFAPRAAVDLEEAADWLMDGRGGPEVAERLLLAAIEAADLLARRPLLGRRRLDLLPDPYRFWSLAQFPYLLVYNPACTPARVLRVLHTARDLPRLLQDLEF